MIKDLDTIKMLIENDIVSIEALHGLSNENYLIRTPDKGKSYVVKLLSDKKQKDRLELFSQRYYNYCDTPEYNVESYTFKDCDYCIIQPYIPNREYNCHQLSDQKSVLQEIVNYSTPLTVEDIGTVYHQYYIDLSKMMDDYSRDENNKYYNYSDEISDKFIDTLRKIYMTKSSIKERFVHFDLTPSNVLMTDEGVVLIDFEYAGIGNKELDLASLLIYQDFYKFHKDYLNELLVSYDKKLVEYYYTAELLLWYRWTQQKINFLEKDEFKRAYFKYEYLPWLEKKIKVGIRL